MAIHSLLSASLLLGLLLQACGSPPVVVSEQQRAACRFVAEQGATSQEAIRLNAACLKRAIEAKQGGSLTPSSEAPSSPSQPSPPDAGTLINRYAYCVLHKDKVIAASSDLTSASKLWLVAPSRYAPDSYDFREAKRNYVLALARLERLLPPDVRQGMDLIPQAVQAFSRCNIQELS